MVSALAFNVIAGINDGGNLLASAASSRTIPVVIAFVIIILCAFAGPLVFGTAVAATLGAGIADYSHVGLPFLLAAVAASLMVVFVANRIGFPTSMSLALVSAMVGSLVVGAGPQTVHWSGVIKVVGSAFGSAFVGFLMGAAVYGLLHLMLRPVTRRVGDRIMQLQYGTVALQALGYGANDAEKMMGFMAAAVSVHAPGQPFTVPLWAIGAAIAAFAVGMVLGGMRVAKTIGGRLFTIRPEYALAFQAAAGITVIGASLAGAPLSTTETTASAIVGTGAAARPRRVHWQVVGRLVSAWFITVPAALAAGAIAGVVLRLIH